MKIGLKTKIAKNRIPQKAIPEPFILLGFTELP